MIIIDKEKCTGCGLCASDCLLGEISLVDGRAQEANQVCYDCGHCVAICPEGAICPQKGEDQILEYDPSLFVIDSERLLNMIRFRRSIRHYKEKKLPREVLEKALEGGMYAPTGRNSQSVRYVVAEKEKDMLVREALSTLNQLSEEILSDPGEAKITKLYAKMWQDLYHSYREEGRDGLFYGAPAAVLVIASQKKSPSTAEIDGAIAAANIELMANTLGLGTCYCGFFNRAFSRNRALQEFAGLKAGEILVTSFAIGYPAVSYYRTTARRKDKITWR